MKKNTILAGLVVGGALSLSSFTAQASTINYSASYTGSPTNSFELLLPKFDPTLGNLTSVTMTFKGVQDSNLQYVNNTASSRGATVTSFTISLSAILEGIGISSGLDDFTLDHSPISTTTIYSVAANTTLNVPFSYTDNLTLLNNSTVGLSNFLGTGTYGYQIFTGNSYNGSAIGMSQYQSNLATGSILSLTYTYDAPPPSVPEPATMLLFGAGLAGLASLAGFSRKKK